MSYDYEGVLEDIECPKCKNCGMESNGSYTYICPMCGEEGSFLDPDWEEKSNE